MNREMSIKRVLEILRDQTKVNRGSAPVIINRKEIADALEAAERIIKAAMYGKRK